MNFSLILKLAPLMPRIEKAFATIQRLENDPDVKDAIALAEEIVQIVTVSTATEAPNSPGLQPGGPTS